MQAHKNESNNYENVIFDNEAGEKAEPVIENKIVDIMGIPGTPHEKLLALSKML